MDRSAERFASPINGQDGNEETLVGATRDR